jgi:hypothetical protein
MGWAHATRELSNASDAELAVMNDAARVLMDHQRRISPRVMTELCLIREETGAEMRKRAAATASLGPRSAPRMRRASRVI